MKTCTTYLTTGYRLLGFVISSLDFMKITRNYDAYTCKKMFTQKSCLPVSTPRKRKRSDKSQLSEEGEISNNVAPDGSIPVENDGDNVNDDNDDDYPYDIDEEDDISSTEINATTYLYRVREEARRLPDIWTSTTIKTSSTTSTTISAQVPTSSRKSKQTSTGTNNLALGSISSLQYLMSHRTKIYPPPTSSHLPVSTKRWVDETLSQFSQLRLYIEQCKAVSDGHDVKVERQPVPPMKEYMSWYTFCIGHQHGYPNNIEDNPRQDDTTLLTPIPTKVTPAWEVNLPSSGHGYTPTVRLLRQMDQVMVRRVLCHLTKYVDTVLDTHRSNSCYMWLYALLARLERPIHRDDAVTLYTLLKSLTLLRRNIPVSTLSIQDVTSPSMGRLDDNPLTESTLDMNPSNVSLVDLSKDRQFLATLNTLIAIVGIYFEQGGTYTQVMEVQPPG
jgi:gem associated protein 2